MQLFDKADVSRSALFSDCERYRYLWTRSVPGGDSRRVCNFLMLNPSTADCDKDDRTTARCAGFAERFGCGLLVVSNVFAFRATKPADMKAQADPVGPLNDGVILAAAKSAEVVVAAWGSHGEFRGRASEVYGMLSRAGVLVHALRLTASGQPGHPLYVPGDTRLVVYISKALHKGATK